MLKQRWFSLLKANLTSSILLTAAFGAPMIITYYLAYSAFISTETPSVLRILASTGGFLFPAVLPFAIYRATVGENIGFAITNTVKAYKQVFQYLALLIPRALIAFLIAFGLALILGLLVGSYESTISTAVYKVVLIVIFEFFRFRLLVVPPMLVATDTDRKTAAKFSRRASQQPGVLRLFAFIDGIPLVVANLLWFVLPPIAGFWLEIGVITLTGALSAILAAALWMLNENAGEETAESD